MVAQVARIVAPLAACARRAVTLLGPGAWADARQGAGGESTAQQAAATAMIFFMAWETAPAAPVPP